MWAGVWVCANSLMFTHCYFGRPRVRLDFLLLQHVTQMFMFVFLSSWLKSKEWARGQCRRGFCQSLSTTTTTHLCFLLSSSVTSSNYQQHQYSVDAYQSKGGSYRTWVLIWNFKCKISMKVQKKY